MLNGRFNTRMLIQLKQKIKFLILYELIINYDYDYDYY
jgi:hypothetical protein